MTIAALGLALVATLAAVVTLSAAPAGAQAPLDDERLERQALAIERQLLCPQCTNERLDVCEIAICRDMKRVIRERLAAGDAPDEIITGFANRYGDRVLADLPKEGFNLALFGWVGASVLGVAALGAWFLVQSRRATERRRRERAASGR